MLHTPVKGWMSVSGNRQERSTQSRIWVSVNGPCTAPKSSRYTQYVSLPTGTDAEISCTVHNSDWRAQ
jgi:hypothetical protein